MRMYYCEPWNLTILIKTLFASFGAKYSVAHWKFTNMAYNSIMPRPSFEENYRDLSRK